MNALIKQIVVALALVAPVAAFAQSNQPLTRDQVRADLTKVEKAGYNPLDRMHYPDNIEAAEQRVSAQEGIAQAGTSGYGSAGAGTSQSGSRTNDGAASSYSPPLYQHNN